MSAPRVCGIDGTSLIEQSMDPLAGELIERYRIVENIGRGGVGCVYRGVDGDRQAAIKVLYGDFACDTRFQARFRREAHSISQIVHPNVVALEGFGSTPDGLMFLIMELVQGRTLEDVISREAPLAPYRSAQIVRQIASGLGAAHALGFVHRDMKPGNVMLADEDGIETVKILDFGVVNLLESKTDPRLTATGHIVGTPVYIAPEQIHQPDVGPSADLYAVGVLLYEMLTGTPPFVGRTFAELMLKHLAETPKKAPPNSGLEDIAAALLEKSPDNRPASTLEVIQMIDRLRITVEIMPRAALSRPEQTVRTQAPVAIDKPDDEPFEDPASQFGTVTVRRTLDGPEPDRPTPRDLSPLPFAIAQPLRVSAEDALTQIAVMSPEAVDPFDEPADRTHRDVLDRQDTTPPPRVTVRASEPPDLEEEDDEAIDEDRALYQEIMGMRAKAGPDRADTNRGATVAVAPPPVGFAKRLGRAAHDPRVLTAVGALTFLIAGAIALSILTR